MKKPKGDEHQRAFERYLALWMIHFMEGMNDAHLVEKVKRRPDGSETEEGAQMRVCIEQALASAVDDFFDKIEEQQIVNEANRIIKRRPH